ncbi:Inhibitory regulator protein BUD2/CLA2 [Fulvia fulva]|uniref:Inhibitory regulator protein BUD2/CLA2 n=1 Tax=Passalora fulva TaxID=5499 RepID=A0A9Q8UU61_PASFU|nr:Inhibitory regulator protein BUD2/CLA2 [Fulvia fulva]KAK4626878.1 Inhibitory regulator protein BUD2/CLA2 [Fulvia fulva]KAK4627793.1 Inhibitory regulator protein BUD2/CLA2 [Fulvia fulva]UJO22601.1 Inhibitory regulator protein BUD2/CLA2 [Fulvia fulva]WPV14079.1 Inhibitory regulator protein BUD2/CLA2 [Fulvia fulva]WPV28243.1 Inhibitory regulator protein BUD2/CLA2 [Fulvia fulva]
MQAVPRDAANMSAGSQRRRSDVWQTQSQAQQSDAMLKEKENRRQHRWTHDKSRKEPTLYDEWLSQEQRTAIPPHQQPQQHSADASSRHRAVERRPSMPLRQGSTTASAATIRTVTPDDQQTGLGMEHNNLPESTTMNFERVFIPHTTTTIVGGAAAAKDSPSSRSKRASKDRHRNHSAWASQASSPPTSRNGSVNLSNSSFLGRSESKSNGQQRSHGYMNDNDGAGRPRTQTLESRTRREQSPTALLSVSRNRVGSVHTPSSPVNQGGAEFLASMPVSTELPSAPSVSSLGSPVNSPDAGHRSISPISTSTVDSITSALPSANARRILHLMKTLNGRMSGNVVFRRGHGNPWSQSYCYIQEESGSLMYESRSDGSHKSLISDLRGSKVRSNLDNDVPYLEVSFAEKTDEIHIKLQTQSDFDAWFAALLHWTPRDTSSASSNEKRPDSEMGSKSSTIAENSGRRASVSNATPSERSSHERPSLDRTQKTDRRKSVIGALPKENPVIKIGKMIYWDTNVGYSNASASTVGQPSSRPSTNRMQSVGARRWRMISGQLRENGELKLHADADNALLSVVQLSQLSRCAIQRLDSSVLDNDFCIAIYPQYTSSHTVSQPGFIRPIFLSLESRVLYEVWFVLLRAFTMPSIYGPRLDAEPGETGDVNGNRDLESMIATSTTYTFRMERSLSVRVVEAKMQPPSGNATNESSFSGGYSRQQSATSEKHGYYAEVLLDNETRGKTVVKYDGLNPLWGENFEFQDLPPVLNNASVVVKRRPAEQASLREQQGSQPWQDGYGDQQGGFTNLAFDIACGKMEIQMEELEPEKEIEKWWPVMNMHGHRVGEILIKVRADEGIILMARDYRPLGELLHRFSNGLTLQIAQMIPSELKRLGDSLLNIYQVAGKAGDWIMALVEEEIDGIHKETPITQLRYSRRVGSNDSHDPLGSGAAHTDRELIVRDMNKNATLEANLLFRGNTLLTKSLDTHMRRIGKEYLEESLATKIQGINEKDLDCEVDPNRVKSPQDVDRNWGRLLTATQDVWRGILANKQRCPVELRIIFRHIRACAEDRYGDFLRSVSYSSVSGFLFLRFFCPAVLNPKLFGLLKDDIKPRARRTFTLIAKSLQTMANMAAFGTKEPWMEPMNAFLIQHRESFKSFIDDVCHVPTPLSSNASFGPNSPASPTYPPGVVTAEQHLSYTTPMTIMQRLPPSSREGFPSLPYLIDQARSFADLIHLWLEAVSALSNKDDSAALPGKTHLDVLAAIEASEGDLKDFHQLCEELNTRTQECLNRAERAERPDSSHSFQWEDVISQLQKAQTKSPGGTVKDPFDIVADKIASDPNILPEDANPAIEATLAQLRGQTSEDTDDDQQGYAPGRPSDSNMTWDVSRSDKRDTFRPGSASLGSSLQGRSIGSPGASASASQSNISSTVSSDTEHTNQTTALPSYEREVRHRERREQARVQIQKQMEAARVKEKDKEKKKTTVTHLVPKLKRRNKHKDESANGTPTQEANGMI